MIKAKVVPEPSPTILQWVKSFWVGYQEASSVLTPLENDAWLADSVLQTFVGPRLRREDNEAQEADETGLARVKRFLFVIPAVIAALVPTITGIATGFFSAPKPVVPEDDFQQWIRNMTQLQSSGMEGNETQMIPMPLPLQDEGNNSETAHIREKRMVSTWIPLEMIDQLSEVLNTPLLGNQTLLYPRVTQNDTNAATMTNQTAPASLQKSAHRWTSADVFFTILGLIGLALCSLGLAGFICLGIAGGVQEAMDPEVFEKGTSGSTLCLITDLKSDIETRPKNSDPLLAAFLLEKMKTDVPEPLPHP